VEYRARNNVRYLYKYKNKTPDRGSYCSLMPNEQFLAVLWEERVTLRWYDDDDDLCVLD
jgi:hypothetical protein